MITDDELDAMNRRIQAAGSANCWTGTAGSIAADARRLVNALRAPRPRLIGFTGPAGCGKDLAASFLEARRVGFADPLYRGLATMLGVPEERLRDRAMKERPIVGFDVSPRRLLQTLGTEWGRRCVAEDLWVDMARRQWCRFRALGETVVVPDVRFANEAEAIRADGGEVWMIHRPSVAAILPHVSEAGLPLRLIDRLVVNDGTVDQLRERVRETLNRCRQDDLPRPTP